LQEKVFESTHQEKILLVLNVDPFARQRAEENFERTLEVIASLAVQLDGQGHSVGFVTNGKVKGGGSTFVPTARNPQQIPAILELLARLQMRADGDFKDVLSRRLALSWGISCVHFACGEEDLLSAKEYLAWRKIPAVFLVSRSRIYSAEESLRVQGRTYCLDDVCSRGAEKR
jgi:uncharacterized protein (DUF58 family)